MSYPTPVAFAGGFARRGPIVAEANHRRSLRRSSSTFVMIGQTRKAAFHGQPITTSSRGTELKTHDLHASRARAATEIHEGS